MHQVVCIGKEYIVKLHILDTTQLVDDISWEQLQVDWNTPKSFKERMDILSEIHELARYGNEVDIFRFLLRMADGYGVPANPLLGKMKFSTWKGERTAAEIKKGLSCKAFTVLCNHFFTDRRFNSIAGEIFSEPLFSELLEFFGPKPDRMFNNISPSMEFGTDGGKHYIESARKFATMFVTQAWTFLNGYTPNLFYLPSQVEIRNNMGGIIRAMMNLQLYRIMEEQPKICPKVFWHMVNMFASDHDLLDRNGKPIHIGKSKQNVTTMPRVRKMLTPFVVKHDHFAVTLHVCMVRIYEVVQ